MTELKFALFILLVSAVFFLPSGLPTLICAGLSLVVHCLATSRNRLTLHRNFRKLLRFLLFVGFVVLCNALFAGWAAAVWVGAKLITVCILTLTYSALTPASATARTLANLLRPLRKFGLEPEEAYLLVAITFRLMPILRRTFAEIRTACRAKGAKWNLKTARAVLARVGWQMLARVEQIERALIAKGF